MFADKTTSGLFGPVLGTRSSFLVGLGVGWDVVCGVWGGGWGLGVGLGLG